MLLTVHVVALTFSVAVAWGRHQHGSPISHSPPAAGGDDEDDDDRWQSLPLGQAVMSCSPGPSYQLSGGRGSQAPQPLQQQAEAMGASGAVDAAPPIPAWHLPVIDLSSRCRA